MLNYIGTSSRIVRAPDELEGASAIILPGVGAFDSGMQYLDEAGFSGALRDWSSTHCIPILGICLGAQLLTRGSDEGRRPGLGLLDAHVRRFVFTDTALKVPHIGWSRVQPSKHHRLFGGFEAPPRFYFVHSYYLEPNNAEDILAETNYGHKFASALQRDNIVAVQFHPEKSHRFGVQFFRNFVSKASS